MAPARLMVVFLEQVGLAGNVKVNFLERPSCLADSAERARPCDCRGHYLREVIAAEFLAGIPCAMS